MYMHGYIQGPDGVCIYVWCNIMCKAQIVYAHVWYNVHVYIRPTCCMYMYGIMSHMLYVHVSKAHILYVHVRILMIGLVCLESLSLSDTRVTSKFIELGGLNSMSRLAKLNLSRTAVCDRGQLPLTTSLTTSLVQLLYTVYV